MRKSKQKSASPKPKHATKKSVKITDLPAKDLQDREVLGGGSLRSSRPLNYGL